MAAGLVIVTAVLLSVSVGVSCGIKPFCRWTTSTSWTLIECDGNSDGNDLTKWLSNPLTINISSLTLNIKDTQPSTGLDFSRLLNLTYLRIQTDNLSDILSNITGLNKLKSLNLSSNNIHSLSDISHLSQLEELDLSNNFLRQVDFLLTPPSLTSLNLHCNRIEMDFNVTLPILLESLDLSYNHMVSVQPILSETLKRLNLSGNNITDLSFVTSLVSVEELDFSDNNITQLEDNTFITLSGLVRLDLSRNYLKFLKEKSFSGLYRLQIIDLSHNLLQSITPGTFQYLNNLVWLNLADNKDLGKPDDNEEDSSILLGAGQKLQTVDSSRTNLIKIPNTLTRSIRNLYLSCNRISTIRCGDLDSFLLLQFLDLTSNNISTIEDDALGRLELLCYLLLSENILDYIPHSLPDNLLVLDLDHNRIQNLSASDFFGLSKLRTLRLAWNRITVIHDGAFGQLSSLQNLDLSGNPLKVLYSSTFVGPRRLINLSLSSLVSLIPTKGTLAFPVPESSHLQVLNLENSPVLVSQLMDDVAALSMFRHINVLNLACSRITSLRSDLVNFFPRLQVLDLRKNYFNCTDIIWLSKWLKQLRDGRSDDMKFQSLEENSSTQVKYSEFDVTQDINAYKNRLKHSPKGESPKCTSPIHLAGVSLYDLNTTNQTSTAAAHQKTRYDRPNNFIIRKMYDHEFYQNDFPPPVNDPKIKQEPSTTADKLTDTGKRQIKRSNATVIPNRSTMSMPNETNFNPLETTTVKADRNETISTTLRANDGIKAEFLRSDEATNLSNSNNNINDTNKELKNKTNQTKNYSYTEKSNIRDVISIYSPLDVNFHDEESNSDRSKKTDTKSMEDTSDDNTLSVSSPQKISIDEDIDVTKELQDNDDEDLNENRYTHHPGLIVFFMAAAVLGITAVIMRASQRRQNRNGYAQQQDIEVRSLDLSAQELW